MVEYDLRDCKSKGMDTSSTIISTRWHHIHQQSYSNSNPAGTDIGGRVHAVSGKLSLLPSVSTSRSVVMLHGWGVKAGWLIPYMDKRVGGR